jgi:hypothetical protein
MEMVVQIVLNALLEKVQIFKPDKVFVNNPYFQIYIVNLAPVLMGMVLQLNIIARNAKIHIAMEGKVRNVHHAQKAQKVNRIHI